MSIPIVLDKSTFQGLNYKDIIELHRYYTVNITPLLVSEILGDLSKEEKAGRKTPKEEVINLSKKLFPYNSYVNMPYELIIENSFLGNFVDSENRPFLIAEESISTKGKKGLTFKETDEELSIKRWKKGEFNSLDDIASTLWRKETKDENVIEEFKAQFEHLKNIKVTNTKASNPEKLQELKEKLFERINIEMEPEDVLERMLNYFKIDAKKITQILDRWNQGGFVDLEKFAEYAYYCYSVVSMFYIGMNNSLFGDRLTNLLDLEYLFYAPFSKVFTSNDKFLISLYNTIQPKNVVFISLDSLKTDLKKFQEINTSENFSKVPPDKSTETFKIWDNTFDLELTERLKPTEKDLKRAEKEFEEVLKMAESGESGNFEGEPDFLVKKSFMSLNDPCVCVVAERL
ncbi:paraquat-inducible protein B [Zobellia uliginosa]|uniref:paraquat-inducible protein B n=1 Tax=Zobellia uliginosa TaxID=143224 RepID=UPI0026E46BCB|nr:paraquat-inducible protein B [Zobellia uliginosa]MDO6518481.1 paraquat-inducible protein B [Zobellia uliginosa]